jgi:hypothetical protein
MYSVTGWHVKMTWCVVKKILMRFEFLYKIGDRNNIRVSI